MADLVSHPAEVKVISQRFGKGAANNGPTDTLFFTAGPDGESHGLFGTIRAAG